MEKVVKFKKNRRQMPHIVHLALFLFVLSAVCALILAFVNKLTIGPITAHQEEELQATLNEVGLESAEDLTNNYTLVDNVNGIYYGTTTEGVSCYAFNVSNKNKFTTVTAMVVIDANTNKIINIKVIGSATTLGSAKDNLFLDSNFGVVGSSIDEITDDSFVTISGATWSSKSVKTIINTAYQMLEIIVGDHHE